MMPVDHSDNEPTDQGGYDKEVDKSSGNRPTTPKPTTQKRFSEQPEPMLDLEEQDSIPSSKEINDEFSRPDEAEGIGGSFVKEIIGHEWKLGQVHFRVK
jgi:hypothetical protein